MEKNDSSAFIKYSNDIKELNEDESKEIDEYEKHNAPPEIIDDEG